MLALVLSTALLAAASPAPTVTSTPLGYSEGTTRLLEKIDAGMNKPVRTRRPITVGSVLGTQGLGLNVDYNLNPHFTLGAEATIDLAGGRGVLQGRYNILKSNWTPYLGLGAGYLLASDFLQENFQKNNRSFDFRVNSAPYATGVFGVGYQGDGGFSFTASLGWRQLLDRKSNVDVLYGRATKDDGTTLNMLAGSGPIASVMFGRSF